MADITQRESDQVEAANASGRTPVVFVHGLWLLPSSWDKWREVFADAGYTTLAPGWPDDPDTVQQGNENPEVFARKSVGQVADHFEAVISKLSKPPAVIGHSFGGLLAQIIAGRDSPTSRWRSIQLPSGASCHCRSRHSNRRRRCSGTPPTTVERYR